MWLRAIGLIVIFALTFEVYAAPFAVEAQQVAGKVPRIGLLMAGSSSSPAVEVVRQGLRDLGYIEGQHIAIEARYADDYVERLPALAAEL